MQNKFLISMILVAFAVAKVLSGTSGTRVNVTTPAQLELIEGVFKKQHWPEQWDSVDLLLELNDQLAGVPDTKKKLEIIVLMMECAYGQRFHWFLTLAACVIDRCNALMREGNDASTGQCWEELGKSLLESSYTTWKVIRTLEHVHKTVGDRFDQDVFYQKMWAVQNFLTERTEVECFAAPDGGSSYIDELADVTKSLQDFFSVNCLTKSKPLDMEALIVERGSRETYRFYVDTMNKHVRYVDTHLDQLGFHCDERTGCITFKQQP